jgi:hypothetical protein
MICPSSPNLNAASVPKGQTLKPMSVLGVQIPNAFSLAQCHGSCHTVLQTVPA